jgi:hypothetical protein
LEGVIKNWIIYDTSGLETAARKAMDEQNKNMSLVDGSREAMQEFLGKSTVLPEVQMVGKEDLDGTKVYHLKLEPSKEMIREIVSEIVPEEQRQKTDTQLAVDAVSNQIDNLVIEAWFGVADTLPRKMTMSAQINMGSLMQSLYEVENKKGKDTFSADDLIPMTGLTSMKLSVSTALVIKDIGKAVTVQVPEPVMEPAKYLEAIQAATKTAAQREAEAKKSLIDADLRVISSGLAEAYIREGKFPARLSTLFPDKYGEYTYKQRNSGKDYVVYVEFSLPSGMGYLASGYQTTGYYGISSGLSYPHQITQRDLD